MANWLSSEDAVIIFSDSSILSCNKAAVRLFFYQTEEALCTQLVEHLLLELQEEHILAKDWLEKLLSEARVQGVGSAVVRGKRANGVSFDASLIVMPEGKDGEEIVYCTKWLPLRSCAAENQTIHQQVSHIYPSSFKVNFSANLAGNADSASLLSRTGLHQPPFLSVENTFMQEKSSSLNTPAVHLQVVQELEKSQQRLKDAFEVTRLSSWEYVVAEDLLLLNEQLRELLGIKDPIAEAAGIHFLEEFVQPDDLCKIRYLVKQVKEVGNRAFKEVIDCRLRRRDGSLIHVLGSVRLELNENHEVVRAYGTAQDITELRLTEQELEEYRTGLEQLVETRTQELRKSEEKLADALRLANLGTWEYDPATACFLVSDNVLEIFGTTPEIEGGNMIPVQRLRQSILADDLPKYLKVAERALTSNEDSYTDQAELRIKRSSGEIRHLFLSIKRGNNSYFVKFYGTLQDISAMRQTEHEKDRLTAIVETTSDIVGIVGVEGQILYLNKSGKEFFGIQDEEALKHKTFSHFQNHRLTTVLSRKELRHADKWGTWSGQNRYVRHDGNAVHVSQVIVSHKNAEGQVECYSTILRDMSEQKKIEQDLIFKNNELDTFIYRASHDLRGPIATLMGLNQIVRFEINDTAAIKYFDLYNSQILRLHNITVSLIELTKIKDRNCEISEIDFYELWQEIKKDIEKLPEAAAVTLEEAIEPLTGFKSDAHLLKIILHNLVENAIRYRRSDVASMARVEVLQAQDAKHVILKVSDNGIGIDSNLQGKIYNMFFRGTERSKGPGLGLYILKNAVEKLHGRITLYSVPYKGTTFKIEIPSQAAGKDLSA